LVRISDLDEVLVIADVSENDIGGITLGGPVEIHTNTDDEKTGTIDYISEVVDPLRHTIEVWVRAKNDDRSLRPNGFAQVVPLPDPTKKVVRVPDGALVTRGSGMVVFVVTPPGRLEPHAIKIGRRRDGESEVRDGLAPGTRYISRGAILLLNQVDLASSL
jgi:multidrug efflux pump subunit AcrA (membrane-fusion protein)